jgi:hypothetical protein
MKSLCAAIGFAFVLSSVAACSGSGLLPQTSSAAARKTDTRGQMPADCPTPNDTGGIMTGDGGGC